MVISFVLFIPVIILLIDISITGLLYLVVSLLWILFITIAISLITASLNVRYRDIYFFVQTLLILWFYLTPILYDLSLIPGSLNILFAVNPLTSVFEIIHVKLLGQGVINEQILYSNIITTVLFFVVGIVIWKKESKFFVDWL